MDPMDTISLGARGDDVLDVQSRLAGLGYAIDSEEHGVFGDSTQRAVREFQQRRQLIVDGMVGEDTWKELVEAARTLGDRVLYLRSPSYRGDDVRDLQARLNLLGFDAGREDGILGDRTHSAIRDFQRNVGLVPDGIVGPVTLEALLRIRPVGAGPGRAAVREGELLRRMAASLEGASIAVDAGHGPADPGAVGPTGLSEAEASALLAGALFDDLVARGAEPFMLRSGPATPSSDDRARRANETGAELLISLHMNSHDDPQPEGASCFYYGREGYVSQAGQRLAEHIQEALTTRLGLKDGRTHPKSLPLLRETRMPAVHVEPCFITNPREEALLRTDRFRQDVAAAVSGAIERFFLPDAAESKRDEARGRPGSPASSARRRAGSMRSASRTGANGR
jgi:N-acetylmuramoyl-L-alanine amidase